MIELDPVWCHFIDNFYPCSMHTNHSKVCTKKKELQLECLQECCWMTHFTRMNVHLSLCTPSFIYAKVCSMCVDTLNNTRVASIRFDLLVYLEKCSCSVSIIAFVQQQPKNCLKTWCVFHIRPETIDPPEPSTSRHRWTPFDKSNFSCQF